jgi:hypothetical protein
MMEDDYINFILEPHAVCPDKFCNMFGLKLTRITVSNLSVGLYSDCKFCGKSVLEKINREDMIHFCKMFLQGKEIGTQFRKFRLGIFYPELLENKTMKTNYKKFFLEVLQTLRKTVLKKNGKKFMVPNLGSKLEKLLNDRF